VSDEYDGMSRDELLVRVRDWRQLANERSAEIARLVAERVRLQAELSALHDVAAVLRDGVEEYAGVVARVVAERDRLLAVEDALRDVTEATDG
jgi:cell division protein FtsB